MYDNNDFDKNFKRVSGLLITIWAISAAASIGLTVAIIWGIVKVVQHFT